MLTLIATIATVSGLCAGFLPLLQIVKMWGSRSSVGLSLPYVAGGLVNTIIWNVYSFSLGNLALELPNLVNLTMGITLLTVALAVRHPRFAGAAAVTPDPAGEVAKAVVDDPALAAEFAALVASHHGAASPDGDRWDIEDTLVLPSGLKLAVRPA